MNRSLDKSSLSGPGSTHLGEAGSSLRPLRGVSLHRQGEVAADERATADFWQLQGFSVEMLEDPTERWSRLPDLRLSRDGKPVAFCEVKTAWRHRWSIHILHDDRPVEVREEISEKPALERLANDLFLALQQLEAENQSHELLNIAVLVNRDAELSVDSLLSLLSERTPAAGRSLKARRKAREIEDMQRFRRKIDLCLWVNSVGPAALDFADITALVRDPHVFEILGWFGDFGPKQMIFLDSAA